MIFLGWVSLCSARPAMPTSLEPTQVGDTGGLRKETFVGFKLLLIDIRLFLAGVALLALPPLTRKASRASSSTRDTARARLEPSITGTPCAEASEPRPRANGIAILEALEITMRIP